MTKIILIVHRDQVNSPSEPASYQQAQSRHFERQSGERSHKLSTTSNESHNRSSHEQECIKFKFDKNV
jgi:hypothetical protein